MHTKNSVAEAALFFCIEKSKIIIFLVSTYFILQCVEGCVWYDAFLARMRVLLLIPVMVVIWR